jgi:hypothetical protein
MYRKLFGPRFSRELYRKEEYLACIRNRTLTYRLSIPSLVSTVIRSERIKSYLSRYRQGQEIRLFSETSTPALGLTHPSVLWAPASLPGVKWDTVDHWPSSSSDIKNKWICTSTRPIRYQGVGQGLLWIYYVSKHGLKLNSCMLLLSGLAERKFF